MLQIKHSIVASHEQQDIIEYQLIAANGFQVNLLNYGGIIRAIYTPDKNGKLANIVAYHEQFEPENDGHLGAITGRIAGRIAGGKFNLDGKDYQLALNNGVNNLHAGPNGLDKKIWLVSELNDGVELTYFSPAGECGFPANVEFKVRYRISAEYRLSIEYFASCDAPTLLNLTNHSYFDLSAGVNSLGMELTVPAESFAEVDASGCVTGTISSVVNTPFDFRQAKPLGRDIHQAHTQLELANQGYDHPFILTPDLPIKLVDPLSQRYLNVTTTENCCVVYSGNFRPIKHSSLCLETQKMPNAINWPEYRQQVIFNPTKPYFSQTEWQFGVLNESA